MTGSADAFGAALLDVLAGGTGSHLLERDDGQVWPMDATEYFDAGWFPVEEPAADLVAGRILDVGAGAGRHTLDLQARGDAPTALDVSPGAVEVCTRRGVAHSFLGSVADLAGTHPEPFDAAILLGHNLGILGSEEAAPDVLDPLRAMLRPGGLAVGTCRDPYATEDPGHLAYHDRNRAAGRYPGQVRMRVRFGSLVGAWFDWLFLSIDELAALAARNGWRLDEATNPDPTYLAVLRLV